MAVQCLLRPAAHAKVIGGDGLYAIFLERMPLCHEQLMVLMIKLCHAAEGEPASRRGKGEKDLLTAVLIEQVVEDTAAQNPIK
jgi:hypothetical protein